jgi:hypothetical protein
MPSTVWRELERKGVCPSVSLGGDTDRALSTVPVRRVITTKICRLLPGGRHILPVPALVRGGGQRSNSDGPDQSRKRRSSASTTTTERSHFLWVCQVAPTRLLCLRSATALTLISGTSDAKPALLPDIVHFGTRWTSRSSRQPHSPPHPLTHSDRHLPHLGACPAHRGPGHPGQVCSVGGGGPFLSRLQFVKSFQKRAALKKKRKKKGVVI